MLLAAATAKVVPGIAVPPAPAPVNIVDPVGGLPATPDLMLAMLDGSSPGEGPGRDEVIPVVPVVPVPMVPVVVLCLRIYFSNV